MVVNGTLWAKEENLKMKKLLVTLLCLVALSSTAQTRAQRGAAFDRMNSAMRRNYVSDADVMRRSGWAAAIAGVAVIGANIYEGHEAWKHAKKGGGWVYDPYLKQSTRPIMLSIGVTLTIGGTLTALTN
jgi:hypothetical protein